MGSGPQPLSNDEFADLMARLGPFEDRPHLALAVSGGADSLALALLGDAWCSARGGRATALTVDHGLRPEAADEAARVGRWLGRLGIEHRVLTWTGPTPSSGVQAAARALRYDLLGAWCRDHGALHLVLAHTLEDQAETFLMRLEKGSGPDGLAAMSAIRELPACRLVRPLLGTSKAKLRATLEAVGQDWIEDPSNDDRRFTRVRVRRAIETAGLDPAGLARAAARYGQARVVLEGEASRLMARCVTASPAGFAYVDRQALASAPADLSVRVLSRLLTALGGTAYPPGRDRVERLLGEVTSMPAKPRTLGRCLIAPAADRLMMCREDRGLPPPLAVAEASGLVWDGRYEVGLTGGADGSVRLAALGRAGWVEIAERRPDLRETAVPLPALHTLPALIDGGGVVGVPHLGYRRAARRPGEADFARLALRPTNTLSGSGFFVA